MVSIEVDPIQVKRWLKLFIFRMLVLGANYLAIMDGLASMGTYNVLRGGGTSAGGDGGVDRSGGNFTNSSTAVLLTTTLAPTTVAAEDGVTKAAVKKKPPKIGYCDMKKKPKQVDVDSCMLNFHMSLFLLFGFYGVGVINFFVKTVIHLRLALCSIDQDVDGIGNPLPTRWHKVKDMTFNIASFPCDMGVMSCIVGLYAAKRGKKGLGCWECFLDDTCLTQADLDGKLFLSSLSLNVNFLLVIGIVFYKGFITYFRATDPEKCDCHCEAPRCVTGCFVSLIITCIVMMPPFFVMDSMVVPLKEVKVSGFSSDLMGKMMLVGMIIWGVALAGICIVLPIKMCLLKGDGKKK